LLDFSRLHTPNVLHFVAIFNESVKETHTATHLEGYSTLVRTHYTDLAFAREIPRWLDVSICNIRFPGRTMARTYVAHHVTQSKVKQRYSTQRQATAFALQVPTEETQRPEKKYAHTVA
jgi:hypothetical protein